MYQYNNSSYSRVGTEVGGLYMFEFSLYGLIFFNVFNYSMYNYKLVHFKNKFKKLSFSVAVKTKMRQLL